MVAHDKDPVVGHLIRQLYITLAECKLADIRLVKRFAVYGDHSVAADIDNISRDPYHALYEYLIIIVERHNVALLTLCKLIADNDLVILERWGHACTGHSEHGHYHGRDHHGDRRHDYKGGNCTSQRKREAVAVFQPFKLLFKLFGGREIHFLFTLHQPRPHRSLPPQSHHQARP